VGKGIWLGGHHAEGSNPEADKVMLAHFKENEKGLVESNTIGQKPRCQTTGKKDLATCAFDAAVCRC
jgi:hypothetical protein